MTDLTVNGRPVRFELDPQTPLLWALRDAAKAAGAKQMLLVTSVGAEITDWRRRDLAAMPVALEVNGTVRRWIVTSVSPSPPTPI